MAAHYESLRVWQFAHQLVLAVYRETERWPKREWYGLSSQVRRAALSIASNIVEGSSRRGRPEFHRFVQIALGSFGETEYQLRVGHELGLISLERYTALKKTLADAGRSLHVLARSLRG